MTSLATKDQRQIMLRGFTCLAVLLCLSGNITAKHHHNHHQYRRYTPTPSHHRHHNRAWGVATKAKISLLNPQQQQQQRRRNNVLNSANNYVLDLRGGGSKGDYPDGDNNNYYDSYNTGNSASDINNNGRGRYDAGGYGDDRGRDDRYDQGSGGGNYGDSSRNNDYAADPRSSAPQGGKYDEYDDRGRAPSRGAKTSGKAGTNPLAAVQSKLKNGDRRIGVPLLGLGVIFTMLGVSLFFNKALMRLGNLMFIAGVPTTIGPTRTIGYFFQPKKTRATACLFAGIFLVFVGWPMFGMALEVFGILNLFGNMFPVFWAVAKNMPFISSLTKNTGSNNNKRRDSDRGYSSDRDPYYEDRRGYENYGDDDKGEPYY